MEQKLKLLYEFMLEHRKFNHELQEKHYKSALLWHEESDRIQKVMSMLYGVANTQSQPKIDLLSNFYQNMLQDPERLTSFESFVELLGQNKSPAYKNLFDGLLKQGGWGEKTSALFVKSIYHTHNGNYDSRLRIWSDAPGHIASDDRLYLPVDRVIIAIFKRLDGRAWNFKSINKCIYTYYKGDEMEVWDDLWFWGFITQKNVNKDRVLEWNPSKYWALECSNKSPEIINEVEELSGEFLSLLD